MYSDPIAYFLTWSCYGTRLHGDPRGTVDRRHNQYDTPTLPVNPFRHRCMETSLAHAPYRLDARERPVVELAIRDHCRHKGRHIHALNVRTTHVHIVVSAGAYPPDPAMEQLKGWGTRRLREASLLGRESPAWTAGGSTVYAWDQEDLFEMVNYVLNGQGVELDRALPMFVPKRALDQSRGAQATGKISRSGAP